MNHQQLLDAFYHLATDEPETLQAVYEKFADDSREAILLQFARKGLVFTVNPDDDTLEVWLEETAADESIWTRVDGEEPWQSLVGSAFGWGWVTLNQQGYCDGALLSFGGLRPSLLLNVSASSISVNCIVPAQRMAAAT